jgi:CubicO group peptidase (beta-lactamase class C family)
MVLYDQGRLDRVPVFTTSRRSGRLEGLGHRASPAHAPLGPADETCGCVARTLMKRARRCCRRTSSKPGQCYIYSDLGADVLGFVIEAATESLTSSCADKVFELLGMNDTFFRPADRLTASDRADGDRPPRGYLKGEVHDENAYGARWRRRSCGAAPPPRTCRFAQMMQEWWVGNGV